jgi:hypothetical protein
MTNCQICPLSLEWSVLGKDTVVYLTLSTVPSAAHNKTPESILCGMNIICIWRNTESNIRLFADDCIIFRRINDSSDVDKLQTDLNKLREWALVNKIKINPGKSKSVSFTKGRVRERIKYYFGDQLIPEVNSFKHLGTIIRSDLNWADHVNYTLRKAWKALHFITHKLKKGNNNMKHLAYTTLARPILEYGAVCWDPYREVR